MNQPNTFSDRLSARIDNSNSTELIALIIGYITNNTIPSDLRTSDHSNDIEYIRSSILNLKSSVVNILLAKYRAQPNLTLDEILQEISSLCSDRENLTFSAGGIERPIDRIGIIEQ